MTRSPEHAAAPVAPPAPRPADAPREANLPRSHYVDVHGRVRRDLTPAEILAVLREPTGRLWVDVDSTNRAQLAMLEKIFKFHPLAIEDTLNPRTRVKVEEYDGYLFITVRVVGFCETTPDPYDLDTTNLYLFLGRNFLVTVHAERSPSVAAVDELVTRSPDVLSRGVARLAHIILDSAVDAYFPILEQIDRFLDDLEARVFERFDRDVLREIFSLKRTLVALRRYLAPQRDVFNVLTHRPTPLLPPETQIYFRDIYDHMLRINESLDTYRELLSSTLESYLTQVSNRLGLVTKGLAIVATLSVPFVVVSGMWGMNFDVIPLADFKNGFWIMLAVQVGIGVGLVLVLKWLKMF